MNATQVFIGITRLNVIVYFFKPRPKGGTAVHHSSSISLILRIGIQTYIINRNAPKLKPIFQEMVDTCYLLTDSLNNNHSFIRNTLYRLDSATDFINSKGMQQEYMEYEENFLSDRYRKLEQIAEPNDMEQLNTDNAANTN